LSQDEIVFGDVQYREPQKLRRPDRDRRWACLAYEVPAPGELPVFLDRQTADAIERHALRDTSVELGGILLGKECVDDQTGEPFVWVTRALEAKHYENTQASFTYTHDSWEEITRERDRLHPDLDVVGWYHTHPDFGVFLSSHDLFIQGHFFAQPLQVAYVVDPVRQTRGFFQWRDGRMAQVGGFYLSAPRADRVALARLANDLESLPNPDGSGGGISPRLEAELIAMLSRPSTFHHAGSSAADRALTASVFGLLGAMLGVVGLAAVLWLNQLNGNVARQAAALADLEKSVRDAADRQRVTLDAVAGEADGKAPVGFLDRYTRTARERDDLRDKLAAQAYNNELLAASSKAQKEELAALKTKFGDLTKKAEKYEKDAKEVGELRTRVDELRANNEDKARRLEELEEVADTVEGKRVSGALRKYQMTWYAAVAGWAVAALLGIGLAGYAYFRLPTEEEPPDQPPGDAPTHRII
jgi:proteasome lid subunit RPN8/RPN11